MQTISESLRTKCHSDSVFIFTFILHLIFGLLKKKAKVEVKNFIIMVACKLIIKQILSNGTKARVKPFIK